EGHLLDLLLAQHGRDCDGFERQRLQHEVERDGRARRDPHVLLRRCSLAEQRRGDGVRARREVGDGVTAVGGRGRAAGSARALVRRPNHGSRRCDGAGPAGATAALALARRGLSVVLLERDTLPRYKTCGGGLVGRALALLPPEVAPVLERRCGRAALHLLDANQHYRATRDPPGPPI